MHKSLIENIIKLTETNITNLEILKGELVTSEKIYESTIISAIIDDFNNKIKELKKMLIRLNV